MKVAPCRVSGRVVKTSMGSAPSTGKRTRAPTERPIQLVCMAFTGSGQSIPSKLSNSSA